jgi:pimeloyl-ACP methyl ester carboxylesterase
VVEVLVAAAVAVAGLLGLLWLGQERLIFFPQPLAGTAHLPPRAEPLEVVAADGVRLRGWRIPGPGPAAPTVLYFGGNAEEISWTLADPRWPAEWAIAGLNYRGYGSSEGRPGEAALVADALAFFDAVSAQAGSDPRRIVAFGRSIGTGVAVQLAAQRPVAGVVLVSPYDSLAALGAHHYPWLPVAWVLRHRFDAVTAARTVTVPMLTIVAAADTIVPTARSRTLFEAWRGPRHWQVIAGADHNDLAIHAAFWDAIRAFLGTLPPPP